MNKAIKSVVIIGGGSAGWLTAGTLAAEHHASRSDGIQVTLVESPDIGPIGVGEGTWPTMRSTLSKMGLSETEFLLACDASFKQGSKFIGWRTGAPDDYYYHPFSLPQGYLKTNLAAHWPVTGSDKSFAASVCAQVPVCDRGLAPKQKTTPEYAGVTNYAYHLDAGKFATLLQRHCTEKLGVRHVLANVTAINSDPEGDIGSVSTQEQGDIAGDLFIDCTGFASLLLGKHYGIPFVSRKDTLFIDSALAIQVPYANADDPIASQTNSTAQHAGWIWDIGLPTRRGVGYVYSSAHTSQERAEAALRAYIEPVMGEEAASASLRKISINPGHRQKFWHRNCLAIGMSAGFLEPLEASALVMVELSAAMVSEQLPATRDAMDVIAKRFNEKFSYRWDRVIDFLKLHYVLSERSDSAFWQDNRALDSIPESLQTLLDLWRDQLPWHHDFDRADEIFPSASYQYVLYGMGFDSGRQAGRRRSYDADIAAQLMRESDAKSRQWTAALPGNRELLRQIAHAGFPAS